MNHQKLFAERIGGEQFGKVVQTFKFTLIDNAKKALLKERPEVRVIDMGVGEPEERAPDNIVERLYKESLIKSNRIYPCNGTEEFKEAASRYLQQLIGQKFDPATEVMHCVGMKTALVQVPLAFVNPGETVISTSPGYPVLNTMVRWLGGKVIDLKLHAKNRYLPELGELENAVKTHSAKMLLLNYPNNPTGGVANLDFYKNVVELAHRYNFVLIQDAAYADLVFDGPYASPFQVDGGRECSMEMYSLSKGYNMQGYRLGFVASNPILLKAFSVVKDNTDNGQFIAIQKAGVEALDGSAAFRKSQVEKYSRRLKRVASILNKAGIEVEPSLGSFYLYFPIPKEFHGRRFETAQEFTNYLVSEFGIISVPWEEAGPHIRLSMTFEIGNKDFADEEQVYAALEERLVNKRLS